MLCGSLDGRGVWGRMDTCISLIQFSVDGRGFVPSLLFDLRPNYGGDNEERSFKRSCVRIAALSAPNPAAGHQ